MAGSVEREVKGQVNAVAVKQIAEKLLNVVLTAVVRRVTVV